MPFSRQSGYSLIELLIVIVLVAVLSLTAANFLFSTLSGSGKASALALVKQNGDFAIGLIERAARNAIQASCPTSDSLAVTDSEGNDRTFSITSSCCPSAQRITSSNSAGDVYLTAERVIAENFSCSGISGSEGAPDIVSVGFDLRIGDPASDRPEEVAVDHFQTRVSLRTY